MVLNLYEGVSSQENPVVLENVSKYLKGKKILDNISLKVEAGKIFSLIGPNGAGKTMTIRTILGLLKPDEGSVKIFGKNPLDLKDRLKMVSCVLEETILWEKFSGIQNIIMFANLSNLNSRSSLNTAFEYAKLLKINNVLQNPVHTYSKGMKRKLSLIMGLIKNPKILIFDEPNSGIDPESRVDIRNILLMVKQQGKTILFTSHDLDEVQRIADYTAVINRGKIVLSGETEKLRSTQQTKIIATNNNGEHFVKIISLLPKDKVSFHIDGNELTIITSDKGMVQEITKVLLNSHYMLKEVKEEKNSLEELYMEILKKEEGN